MEADYPPSAERESAGDSVLYLLPLESTPVVDGESAEWAELMPSVPFQRSQLVVGQSGARVYALIALAKADVADRSRLVFEMSDGPGFKSAWQLALDAAGPMTVHEVAPEGRTALGGPHADRRFSAFQ